MTLDEFNTQLTGSTFWKEFTFSKRQFAPQPGQEWELADGFAWIGETAFVMQMEEEPWSNDDPASARRWFEDAVLSTAVRRIENSLRLLSELATISIVSERNHRYDFSGSDFQHIEKIILYARQPSLPEECGRTQYCLSQAKDFIHVFERDCYRQIVETLAVPEEVGRYLQYREKSVLELSKVNWLVLEEDILAAYLSDEALPTSSSHRALDRLYRRYGQYRSLRR